MTGRLTTLDRDRVEHFMREYEQPCHDGDYPRGQVRLQERYGSQALRRGVATALRKSVPGELQDPGGWASYVSPLKCYIRQDSEAQRAALGRRLETARGHATERGRRVRMHGFASTGSANWHHAHSESKDEAPLRRYLAAALAFTVMGLGRVELPTSRLSGVRSNHLSYRPGSG